jgi:hypothetical protein
MYSSIRIKKCPNTSRPSLPVLKFKFPKMKVESQNSAIKSFFFADQPQQKEPSSFFN